MIVDSHIVIFENMFRRLSESNPGESKMAICSSAFLEVVKPWVFSVFIVFLVFLPCSAFRT